MPDSQRQLFFILAKKMVGKSLTSVLEDQSLYYLQVLSFHIFKNKLLKLLSIITLNSNSFHPDAIGVIATGLKMLWSCCHE